MHRLSDTISRRSFLAQTVGGVTAGSVLARPAWAAPQGANDAIRVGVVGVRGKGGHHIEMLRAIPGVRVVALCDVDEAVLNSRAGELSAAGIQVTKHMDIRTMLENKDVDAVSIATPNHWHSLMAIWACQAGKDVYLEKPISHNVWEGRKVVEAATKYNRIVQAGTQSRSDEALLELAAYLRGGALGRILRARGFCYKRRESIGKVAGPQPIPAGVNYDLFCGPAPLEPLRRAHLHYDWHWIWATGNGDIGNQGVHEMDMCRWMLGEEKLPRSVFSIGGRFVENDDAETPNTQIAVYDYASAPLIFEVRGLPAKTDVKHMDHYGGVRIGIAIECEHGTFVGGGGGGVVYDGDGKRVKSFTSTGGDAHMENFIQAVRSRKAQDLKAPITGGHMSSALCHLGNISYRLGTEMTAPEIAARAGSRADVTETLERLESHLAANGADPAHVKPTAGPMLTLVPDEERFESSSEYDMGAFGNRLLRDGYRPPYVVPEQV
jgi:predicted dehydrogenase